MRRGVLLVIVALVVVLLVGTYLYLDKPSQPLEVFTADAYVGEANYMISGFRNSTGMSINDAKGGGSYTLASEISQGNPAEVFISVALSSYDKQYLGEQRYSGWAVAFAADSLVIAYNNATLTSPARAIVSEFNSASASGLSVEYADAFANLTSGIVKVGISDPSEDPAGLRAMISLEIAGSLYHGGNISYYTGKILSDGGISSASSAAELVAPLEQGSISFLYIYRSAAITKGLDYIMLPQKLSFSNASLASFYSQFSYNTTTGTQAGSPVFLFITALANVSSHLDALKFVCYVINNSGQMTLFGMETLKPLLVFTNITLPGCLTALISDGKLTKAGSI